MQIQKNIYRKVCKTKVGTEYVKIKICKTCDGSGFISGNNCNDCNPKGDEINGLDNED